MDMVGGVQRARLPCQLIDFLLKKARKRLAKPKLSFLFSPIKELSFSKKNFLFLSARSRAASAPIPPLCAQSTHLYYAYYIPARAGAPRVVGSGKKSTCLFHFSVFLCRCPAVAARSYLTARHQLSTPHHSISQHDIYC